MGHTTGRRLTDELLFSIAKGYKNKSEFQKADPSAYVTARKRNLLEHITRHMKSVSFSIPQLICREILDKLLCAKSYYNTRKVIRPFEIDIYYPEFNIAVEYNGKGWHNTPDAIRRDLEKKKLLAEKSILLVNIEEKSRDYEKDIKEQLCQHNELLRVTGLTVDAIKNCKIDWNRVHNQTTISHRTSEIKLIIANCTTIKQFRTKFAREYSFVISKKLHHLLNKLDRKHIHRSDSELQELALNFTKYSDFVLTPYYRQCHKRGILDKVSSHMSRKNSWKLKTDDEIIALVNDTGCKHSSDLAKIAPQLHWEVKHRKLQIWRNGNKTKYSPEEDRKSVETLINSGAKMGEIKKTHSNLYGRFIRYRKKGLYAEKENQNGFSQTATN